MNKSELATALADSSDLTKAKALEVIESLFGESGIIITNAKDKVVIQGFGTWEVKTRAARTGRNPKTGATIQVAAKRIPKFSAGKSFKEAV